MPLETGTYISDLAASNPEAGDVRGQGDDHLRLIKSTLRTTFPNADKAYRFPSALAAQTATYNVVYPDDQHKCIPVDASGGDKTVNLPAMSGSAAGGWSISVYKSDSSVNLVTIDGNGSDTINGETTLVLRRQWAGALLIWNNNTSSWYAFVYTLPYSPPVTKLTTYTIAISNDNILVLCDTSGGGWTLTLPSTGIPNGFRVRVVKSTADANNLTLSAAAGLNSIGTSLVISNRYQGYTLEWTGSYWYIYSLMMPMTKEEFWANTAFRALTTDQIWEAAKFQTLTDGATVTPDFGLGLNWTWTIGGNRTLASPANAKEGQSGTIRVIQDSTGNRVISAYGSAWKYAGGGAAPTLSATGAAEDAIDFKCYSSSYVRFSITKNLATVV